jgi:hypothetical protein
MQSRPTPARRSLRFVPLTAVAALAACVPAPAPLPAPPVVQPAPTPAPSPAPVIAEPAFDNWIDAPQTPGDWGYVKQSTGARADFYGPQTTGTLFAIQCNMPEREILLVRFGETRANAIMQIRTETASRWLETYPSVQGGAAFAVAKLVANDPLLDAMALTRGRFAVETAGLATLYVPAWAEVTRVIEDCR